MLGCMAVVTGGWRTAALVLAYLTLATASAAAAGDDPDGVALADSCGTYVRAREGTESYQPSQLERGRLCADLLWDAVAALKKRVVRPGERRPRGTAALTCSLDPAPVGPHQAVRVAHRYLETHPERLHLPARALADEALLEAFGCEPAPGP